MWGEFSFGSAYFGQAIVQVPEPAPPAPTTLALLDRKIPVSVSKGSWPVSISRQSSPVTVKNDKVALEAIDRIRMTQH